MNDINSLVKMYLESELLARGAHAAVDGTKKIAKGALAVTVGVPTSIFALSKVAELQGKKLSQV